MSFGLPGCRHCRPSHHPLLPPTNPHLTGPPPGFLSSLSLLAIKLCYNVIFRPSSASAQHTLWTHHPSKSLHLTASPIDVRLRHRWQFFCLGFCLFWDPPQPCFISFLLFSILTGRPFPSHPWRLSLGSRRTRCGCQRSLGVWIVGV